MSTDREKISQLLSAYIDGELNESEARQVAKSVENDTDLQKELQQLKQVRRWTSQIGRDQTSPDGFSDRLMERIERKHLLDTTKTHGAFYHTRWFSLAVAAIVLIVVGIGIIIVSTVNGRLTKTAENTQISSAPQNIRGGKNIQTLTTRFSKNVRLGEEIAIKPAEQPENLMGLKNKKQEKFAILDSDTNQLPSTEITKTESKEKTIKQVDSEIYTFDLATTVDTVKTSLMSYGINSIPSKAATDLPAKSKNNYYFTKQMDPQQVQIVVYAPERIVNKLQHEMQEIAGVQNLLPKLRETKQYSRGAALLKSQTPYKQNERITAATPSFFGYSLKSATTRQAPKAAPTAYLPATQPATQKKQIINKYTITLNYITPSTTQTTQPTTQPEEDNLQKE